MKKFSELSKKEHTVESSTNKKDFIKNLVEETIKVVDGEIVGKDTLVKTLNKIIEMNDSKTKIQILESVKLNAYRGGFNFKSISEAIEIEKAKLNAPVIEEPKEEKDVFFAQPNDRIVSVSESKHEKIKSKEEFVEYGKTLLKKAHGDDYDELTATEMLNGIYNDKIYGKVEDWGEAVGILKNSLKESKESNTEDIHEERRDTIVSISEAKEEQEEDFEEAKEEQEEAEEEYEEGEEEIEEADKLSDIADELEDIADELKDMSVEELEEGEEEMEEAEEEAEEEFEEYLEESKKEKCGDEECDDDKDEECEEGCEEEKEEEKCDDDKVKESKKESAIEEVNVIVDDYMKQKSDLSSIYENILHEHHLETKKEKIKFILDNEDLSKEGGLKRKRELENMSDKEIDEVYSKLEKELGMVD